MCDDANNPPNSGVRALPCYHAQRVRMNRRHKLVRASLCLSLAMPLAALACGQSFSAGSGDGGEPDSSIVFGDGGADTGEDVRHDAADAAKPDGNKGDAESTETGDGCVLGTVTNCGSCGNDCTKLPHVMNAQCTSGECSYTCATGWDNCTTNPNAGCQTNTTQQGNCGACNVTCSGATPACVGTGCASGCDAGQTLCSGTCFPNAPDTTAGVFVAPGGAAGACGSEAQPCGTIAAGLAQIASSMGTKTILYLDNGTYTEQVTLPAGITIQGGWFDNGGVWSHMCDPSPPGAIIAAPTGATAAIQASYSGSSELDTVQVQNTQTAGPGVSLYGINALGSTTALVLNDVILDVAGGGAGDAGTAATPGVAGGNGNGSPCTTASDGGNGSNGSARAGATAGVYTMAGYTPQPGQQGTSGGDGQNGPAGDAGTCQMESTAYCCNVNSGCNQGSTGSCITNFCGTQGAPGCGGTQATVGTPGQGGGASIGLFVWGATVTITGGQYTTGNGGAGGPGGAGADGGAGAVGAAGADGKYPSSCTSNYHPSTMIYTCTFGDTTVSNTGGLGSQGGNGGSAGQSGGGSGGDSYCWYTNGGGSVSATGATCSPGLAGLGGSQGAGSSQGANGNSAQHNQ
jgi:hypothetical protein